MATTQKRRWTSDEHDIFGGEAKIYKTRASGDVYQFRCRIPEEKKYVRESLRTSDLEAAISLARKRYLSIHSALQDGKKLFGITLRKLQELYLEQRLIDVSNGAITRGRYGTIATHLEHFCQFKGNIKLAEMDNRCARNYQQFRQLNDVKPVTIRNEQATINAMIKWGFEEKHLNFPKLVFSSMKLGDEGRRDTFTESEYLRLADEMRVWAAKKHNPDPKTYLEKQIVYNFVLVLANTMLRVGEAKQLRWKDVVSTDFRINRDAGSKEKVRLARIRVRAETSKVRKGRDIVVRGGNALARLKKLTKPETDECFVFPSAVDGMKQFPLRKLYASWLELMNRLELNIGERDLTYYSLRHYAISTRLVEGATALEIAKMAGTSITQIDKHYGHVHHEWMEQAALVGRRSRFQ